MASETFAPESKQCIELRGISQEKGAGTLGLTRSYPELKKGITPRREHCGCKRYCSMCVPRLRSLTSTPLSTKIKTKQEEGVFGWVSCYLIVE